MSYNGWKNWATWAAGLHFDFGDIIEEIFDDNKKFMEYNKFYEESVNSMKNIVEETVRSARDNSTSDDEPPVMELYNHVNEIDFEEIFDTHLRDMKILYITGKSNDSFIFDDEVIISAEKAELVDVIRNQIDNTPIDIMQDQIEADVIESAVESDALDSIVEDAANAILEDGKNGVIITIPGYETPLLELIAVHPSMEIPQEILENPSKMENMATLTCSDCNSPKP